jgi:CheY-like chemotaxis protein
MREEPAAVRRRVLVAEDNDSIGQLMYDLLRMWGYDVEVVPHGLAAVERARAAPYDLILMDCHMPVMDGWEATRAIRATERGARVPIVAVTGEGDRDACFAAGMDEYLEKPVRPTVLRATIARWCERGRRASPPPVSALTTPAAS